MKTTLFTLALALTAPLAAAPMVPTPHADMPATADSTLSRYVETLYSMMPFPDRVDYPRSFFNAQVACALRARNEMPWGNSVPEREWRHFVLPVRVNNEALDSFRTEKYEELARRVEGMTMQQAVLEVNHWCHEHVTYRPADARTSSPLATLRTAYGRCGEESTLTVAALRTIGIPARQVYTPRWAHTDDNHAWVEAWVDGTWCFLGACEPEPVLNLGWFNAPASRAMLMHTKVAGNYDGPEDVISRNKVFTEINVTANYAPTTRTEILVTDERGTPVPDAEVSFRIYNYAELYPVFTTRSDSHGRASILTGLGDFVAWAAHPHTQRYGFTAITARTERHSPVRVKLDRRFSDTLRVDRLALTPPSGAPNVPEVSEAARAENNRRLAYEDSLRNTYLASFPRPEEVKRRCERWQLPADRVQSLVTKAEGNHAALFALLEAYPHPATLEFLATLSDKDLRDFSLPVLADHLDELTWIFKKDLDLTPDQRSFLLRYVACPRVATEALTPWRSALTKQLSPKYIDRPADIARDIARRTRDTSPLNPQGLWQHPATTWQLRKGDARARALLFVSACRTLGVAARIDEVTGKTQYAISPAGATEATAEWVTVDDLLAPAKAQHAATPTTAHICLSYDSPLPYVDNPRYYTHFTLSKMENGVPNLLNYAESATWANNFSKARPLEAGNYLLTTGTRLADGTVLVNLTTASATANTRLDLPLTLRNDKSAVQVIGSLNSETRYFSPTQNAETSILATTGRGYFCVGLIRANHEPSNHVLHDLSRRREALEAWGRPILLLFPSADEYARFQQNRSEFKQLPATVHFGIDTNGSLAAQLLGTALAPAKSDYPVITIADTFNRVLFASQGYTIGIGDQLKQTISKL